MSDLSQQLSTLFAAQERVRTQNGNVELLDDNGNWLAIDSGSSVRTEQMIRSRRTRPRDDLSLALHWDFGRSIYEGVYGEGVAGATPGEAYSEKGVAVWVSPQEFQMGATIEGQIIFSAPTTSVLLGVALLSESARINLSIEMVATLIDAESADNLFPSTFDSLRISAITPSAEQRSCKSVADVVALNEVNPLLENPLMSRFYGGLSDPDEVVFSFFFGASSLLYNFLTSPGGEIGKQVTYNLAQEITLPPGLTFIALSVESVQNTNAALNGSKTSLIASIQVEYAPSQILFSHAITDFPYHLEESGFVLDPPVPQP